MFICKTKINIKTKFKFLKIFVIKKYLKLQYIKKNNQTKLIF